MSFITGQFSTAENGITIPCLKTEGHLLVCGIQLRKLRCLFVGSGLLRHTLGCIAQAGLEFTVLLPWSREGWNCRFCSTFDLSKRENLWLLVHKEKRKAEGYHYLFTNLQNTDDCMVKLNISNKLCIQLANKLGNCSLLVAFPATCKIISTYKFAIQI